MISIKLNYQNFMLLNDPELSFPTHVPLDWVQYHYYAIAASEEDFTTKKSESHFRVTGHTPRIHMKEDVELYRIPKNGILVGERHVSVRELMSAEKFYTKTRNRFMTIV